jgi:hypothetical protein
VLSDVRIDAVFSPRASRDLGRAERIPHPHPGPGLFSLGDPTWECAAIFDLQAGGLRRAYRCPYKGMGPILGGVFT